jgi:hypothetical protein
MNTQVISTRCWSTASFGSTAETSPLELSILEAHLELCKASHRQLFALQCLAQTMHGFVATRFVTTLMLLVLLIGVASLVL